MAPRATWKGFLNLSLVSVPVKAYSSTNSGGSISLNQLHAECNNRIKYKTECPSCGEISRSDIVKGYQFAKDQYVVIDLEELEKLRARDETKAIRVDKFISPRQIDALHFSETSYYLVPDGAAGQKPFALLCEAMRRKELVCIARVVLHNKDQLVLVRPIEGLMCATVLRYSSQLKSTDLFSEEVATTEISEAEFKLAETLIDETTVDDFDIQAYHDTYTQRLQELIDAKIEGKELVAAEPSETPPVINLMDALKASVEKVRGGRQATKKGGTPIKKKVAKKGKKKAVKKSSPTLAANLSKGKKKASKKSKKKTG